MSQSESSLLRFIAVWLLVSESEESWTRPQRGLRLSAQLTANYKLESGPCVCECEAFITVLTTLPRPAGLLEVKFIPFFKSVSRLSRSDAD